jgi:hypothetical protein
MREWIELEGTDIWSFLSTAIASRDAAVIEQISEILGVIYETQNIFRSDGSFGNEPGSYGWAAYDFLEWLEQIQHFLGDSVIFPESLKQQMLSALIMWMDFPFSDGFHPMLNQGGAVNQLGRLENWHSDGPKGLRLLKSIFPDETETIQFFSRIIDQENNRTPGSMVDNRSFKVDGWGYSMLRGPGSWDTRMETLLSSKHLIFNPGDHVSNDALGVCLYANGALMTPRYGYHWIGYPALILNRATVDSQNPEIWGSFYHFDDNEHFPSAIAYTDMARTNRTTPGVAHQERWNIQMPEYLFDAYFLKPLDGQEHSFEWGFRNLGEVAINKPQIELVPATNADGTPWDPWGYYRTNTGQSGYGFSTDDSWQADWILNEGNIMLTPDVGNPSNPQNINNYPLPGSRMRLTMAAQPDTKIVTAWLIGPGRNETTQLRQDFVVVHRWGIQASFIDTIEPIQTGDSAFVQEVDVTAQAADGSQAVRVATLNGADWFLVGYDNYQNQSSNRTIGPFTTDAKLVMVRVTNDQITHVMFSGGNRLTFNDGNISGEYTYFETGNYHFSY